MNIEQALAEALEESGYVGNFQGTTVARDILATEPMQAIARQAAIGEAVERLDEQHGEVHLVHDKHGRWWQWDHEGLVWVDAGIEEALRDE